MFKYFIVFISYLILIVKRIVKRERRNSDSVVCRRVPHSYLQEKNNLKDRISELSDDVIGIIISQLKTEEAVRTSVLSRRWKYLWKLTTRFNFNSWKKWWSIQPHSNEGGKELMERKRRNYIRWIEQVVENHENSHLDELVVAFVLDGRDTPYLDKWISFAVSKRAKTIKIKLFPHLDEGDTRNETYSFIKSAPTLSSIEYLTSLSLACVDVSGELIEQLLSVCPLLEDLVVRCCFAYTKNLRNLKLIGPSLKLKYFEIVNCYELESIQICAPNLVSFRLKNCLMSETLLQVENLSCLVDLHIAHYNNYELSKFSSISCFSRLETLTLGCPLNKRLLNLLGHSPFTSLKHLTFVDYSYVRDYMQFLPEFISLCPVLYKFTLKLDCSSETKLHEEMKWGERRLESLKVVELIRSSGHDYEIKIAMFFLRNAIRLDKFIIEQWGPSWRKEEHLRAAELVKTKVPQGVELLIKPYTFGSCWKYLDV